MTSTMDFPLPRVESGVPSRSRADSRTPSMLRGDPSLPIPARPRRGSRLAEAGPGPMSQASKASVARPPRISEAEDRPRCLCFGTQRKKKKGTNIIAMLDGLEGGDARGNSRLRKDSIQGMRRVSRGHLSVTNIETGVTKTSESAPGPGSRVPHQSGAEARARRSGVGDSGAGVDRPGGKGPSRFMSPVVVPSRGGSTRKAGQGGRHSGGAPLFSRDGTCEVAGAPEQEQDDSFWVSGTGDADPAVAGSARSRGNGDALASVKE